MTHIMSTSDNDHLTPFRNPGRISAPLQSAGEISSVAPVSSRSRRVTKNRNPIKQWFYTFPQTNLSKIDFRNSLIEVHSMKYFKIVQEKHADGNSHLHAVVQTTKSMPKSAILKKLKIIFPDDYKRIDVQPVRSIPQSLNYLSKEDQHPLESQEPFKDARNPYAAINLRMARQWGFPTVAAFKQHMESERRNYNWVTSEYLSRVRKLEEYISDFPNIYSHAVVNYACQKRDVIEHIQSDLGYSLQTEMQDFIDYFDKNF